MCPSFKCLPPAILPLFIGFMLTSCVSVTTLQTWIPTYPPHPLEPVPQKVVIANAVDVKAEQYRDKKAETFMQLIDSTMTHAAQEIEIRSQADAEIIRRNVMHIDYRDSVDAIIRSAQATHGMFITSFSAYFVQTHVEVTKTEEGKDREAFYDLVVEVMYVLTSLEGLSFDTLVSVRRFHSSRSVVSGLLAAGPNIVSNRDDVQKAVVDNVDQYLKSFFPGQETRLRKLSFPKEFKAIDEAIDQENFANAFEDSNKLTSSADRKISANAYYICAVLAERESDFESAKAYLQESVTRHNDTKAQYMLADYRQMPRVK